MILRHAVYIDGIAFWSPPWPGWAAAAAAMRGECGAAASGNGRPFTTLLNANERRRAPGSVLLALAVAEQAVADSGHDARHLASIFTSAYGDLPLFDALCRTLATNPLQLSPTRFHHSVHNAASGYWAIASGSRAASSALAAGERSFAAGLLEAASTCVADRGAVLLVGFDTEAQGPLASVNPSRGLLGVALVLAPEAGPRSRWRLGFDCVAAEQPASHSSSATAQALALNAQADALPLFEALAHDRPATLNLPVAEQLHLKLQLHTLPGPAPEA
ncbi:MAG: beta-ketoacyl synthase chain length factor [Pseudomonadota bacterium]|nr:beta-ketoacyl synthase chain length factor [Pseudomonadota bacterium]